ncbi:MAG: hypothetical protein ABEK01_00955 [Candidatus Nanohaloarchaea archaeon]
MAMDREEQDRRLAGIALGGVVVLAAVNYFAGTPVRFFVSISGLAGFVYAARRLTRQFDVPLIFVRRDGVNYWGAAMGGLIGGISGLWGASRGMTSSSFDIFLADLGMLVVYLVLLLTLTMGTVLQDIEDGYLSV